MDTALEIIDGKFSPISVKVKQLVVTIESEENGEVVFPTIHTIKLK